jgi:hypothetical protein
MKETPRRRKACETQQDGTNKQTIRWLQARQQTWAIPHRHASYQHQVVLHVRGDVNRLCELLMRGFPVSRRQELLARLKRMRPRRRTHHLGALLCRQACAVKYEQWRDAVADHCFNSLHAVPDMPVRLAPGA